MNVANSTRRGGRESGYRGVYPVGSGWTARCAKRYIGYFRDRIEAAKAYDRAASEMFGAFATLNFSHDQVP